MACADTEPAAVDAQPVAAKKTSLPRVTGIRHWSTADYTRVAIDLDAEVKYEAGRVPDPDRIFFDLPDTRLASTLVGKSFDVQDGFLKKIRVAQYQLGSTRVVLEVDDVAEYSAFLLPNPYRLIIDIHGREPQPQSQVAVCASRGSCGGRVRSKGCAAGCAIECSDFEKRDSRTVTRPSTVAERTRQESEHCHRQPRNRSCHATQPSAAHPHLQHRVSAKAQLREAPARRPTASSAAADRGQELTEIDRNRYPRDWARRSRRRGFAQSQ